MAGPQPLSWPGVWRGRSLRRNMPTLPSGHKALDPHLPGHGWPLGALSELLTETPGSGEFSLLLPALAHLSTSGQWIMLVDPPWIPYPPAMRGHGVALERVVLIRTGSLSDSLWACEQALRDVRGGAVLAWHEDPGFTRLRRLQLAARHAQKAAFLFRPPRTGGQASPAGLRLRLDSDPLGTRITILKCQGGRATGPILIPRPPHVPGSMALPRTGPCGQSTAMPLSSAQQARQVETQLH